MLQYCLSRHLHEVSSMMNKGEFYSQDSAQFPCDDGVAIIKYVRNQIYNLSHTFLPMSVYKKSIYNGK